MTADLWCLVALVALLHAVICLFAGQGWWRAYGDAVAEVVWEFQSGALVERYLWRLG